MSTLNSNRIPLHVSHDSTPAGTSSYTTYRTTTTKSGGGIDGEGEGGEFHSAYDMRNMNDETERIKSRMREFEDRCRKWREDFFTRTQSNDIQHGSTTSMFDQRVPFHESSSPSFHQTSSLGNN